TKNGKVADQNPVFPERYRKMGPGSRQFDSSAAHRVPCAIPLVIEHIDDVRKRFASGDPSQTSERTSAMGFSQEFGKSRWYVAPCHGVEANTVVGPEYAKSRFAQLDRLFQHRVEHRREVAGRRIDDAQNLGGRGLLRIRVHEFAA